MSDVLGIGLTHYPLALGPPERYTRILEQIRRLPSTPESLREPDRWPAAMQAEYANKEDATRKHQAQLIEGFREVRTAIDDFRPDVVIIFGDDQYENFRDALVPPFCVSVQREFVSRPFAVERLSEGNPWGGSPSEELTYPGAAEIAWELVDALSEEYDAPIPYSYSSLHHEGLTHAFANALLYLDWDRDNPWQYPIIPLAVNAYGKDLHRGKGLFAHLLDTRPEEERDPFRDGLGPGGPTPAACFALGRRVRASVDRMGLRAVVMASSSWSHAFLTEKHHWLWPDVECDRLRLGQLQEGGQGTWGELTNRDVYEAGHHEFRNWICLAGAVPERLPRAVRYIESWICNSDKCFTII